MTSVVTLYSKVYLDRQDDSWCARPTPRLLEHLHNLEGDDTARWIAVLGGIRVALGDPVPAENRWNRTLFVPSWILDSAGMEGDGEELQIRFERCETLPKATKIGLKIMGDVPEGIDLRELLEEPLSSLGVLEVGLILPTPVLEDVHLLVQELEPAGGAVFMDGAEVVLDLETDIVAPAAPEVPAPAPVAPDMFAPMVPMEPQEQESMIPPLAPPASSRRFAHPTGFVPFSGVGRRLCD